MQICSKFIVISWRLIVLVEKNRLPWKKLNYYEKNSRLPWENQIILRKLIYSGKTRLQWDNQNIQEKQDYREKTEHHLVVICNDYIGRWTFNYYMIVAMNRSLNIMLNLKIYLQTGNYIHCVCMSMDVIYHNLDRKTPCLMQLFSEFPSMVTIDRFD
jgi:hypothetical protein